MGKIYLNLNNKKINYLEENDITPLDIQLSSMAGKIVLASMNNIKMFECFDPFKKNEETIKKLIKTGYKAVNKFMETIITQNYHFCPNCGEEIDIERESKILIIDSGLHLKKLVDKTSSLAKELICENCGNRDAYYYDLFADIEEKNSFAQRAVEKGAEMYVKYKHIIYLDKYAYIPIFFDFNQFLQLFNKPVEGRVTDFERAIESDGDKKIIKMLFNDELHKILEEEEGLLHKNMRVELKSVELGSYSRYITNRDYELIKKYEAIGNNQEELRKLI